MIRTIRMNAWPVRQRAEEEAAGLRLAFAGHPVAGAYTVDVAPYQGEFHVTVSGDVDTSSDGFISVIVARVLASHCRAPVTLMQLPRAARQQPSLQERSQAARLGHLARLTRM